MKLRDNLEALKKATSQQKRNHEDTLMSIASAYNQNRTQFYTVIDEWELAVHQLKGWAERRSVQQVGYMTQMERDLEDMIQTNDTEGRSVIGSMQKHGPIEVLSQEERIITPRS